MTDSGKAAERINDLSIWVDSYPPNASRDVEAQLWGRVAKIYEEKDEVLAAMIGYTNQNPRKGVTHTREDVKKELFDTALTALGGVAHMDYNTSDVMEQFFKHIESVHKRAGLSD